MKNNCYKDKNKIHIEFDIDLDDYLFLVCFIRGVRDGSISVSELNKLISEEVMK